MQGMWVGLTCWLCADSAVRPRGPDRYTMLITKKNLFRPTELVKLRRWLSVDVPPEGERKKALLAFQRARAINPHTAAGMVLYKDRECMCSPGNETVLLYQTVSRLDYALVLQARPISEVGAPARKG